MIRVEAFRRVGGYDPSIIAGEEPELCLRIRRDGWKILRIDAEMTLHDMAMTRFGQWWRRCVRAGFAYAEGAALHGRGPERHWVRDVRSILFWGIGLPAAAACWPAGRSRGLSLALLVGYPALFVRPCGYYRRVRAGPRPTPGSSPRPASWGSSPRRSASPSTGRVGSAGRPSRIIEYKGADPVPDGPQALGPA